MLYFICGDGVAFQLKSEEFLKDLRKKNHGIGEKHFDFSQDEIDSFLQKVSQNSMFASKEILIVKRPELQKKFDKLITSLEEFNLADKEIVFLYEETLNEFGKIENELDKKTKDKILKLGEFHQARSADQKKSVEHYIMKELDINELEAKKILDVVGEDFYTLKNEIDKIKTFLNGEPYHFEKIMKIIVPCDEYNLKNLVEKFIISKESKELVKHLEADNLYFPFLAQLMSELFTLYKIKLLIENGQLKTAISYNDFNGNYKNIDKFFVNSMTKRPMPAYPIFLKIKIANNFESDYLKTKILELSDIEYEIKSGEVPGEIGIYKFISNF